MLRSCFIVYLHMKFNELLKTLGNFKNDLEVYKTVFIRNNDQYNYKESLRLISIINEFLEIYLMLDSKDKQEQFYNLITTWNVETLRHLTFLKRLNNTYLSKEQAIALTKVYE